MGTCKYCEASAGMFRDEHPACARKAQNERATALASLTEVMKRAVLDKRISCEVATLYRVAKTEDGINISNTDHIDERASA